MVVLAGRAGASVLPRAVNLVRTLGPWAAVGFIVLYAGATVAWVPASLLTLAAGATFGLLRGTAYTLVGATLGATLAFLISRHVARGWVVSRIGRSVRFRAVDTAVASEGFKIVFLLRLSPAFPFSAMNYALGLTPVRLRDYVVASLLGMAPASFLYNYAGFTAGQVAMGGSAGAPRGVGHYVLLGGGLAATVAVTAWVTRIARRALRDATGPDPHGPGDEGPPDDGRDPRPPDRREAGGVRVGDDSA